MLFINMYEGLNELKNERKAYSWGIMMLILILMTMTMMMTTMTKPGWHAAVKLPPQRNPTSQFPLPAISLILISVYVFKFISKHVILNSLKSFSKDISRTDIISNLLVRRQHIRLSVKPKTKEIIFPDPTRTGFSAFAAAMMIFFYWPTMQRWWWSLCIVSLSPSQDFTLFGRTCFSSQAAQYCSTTYNCCRAIHTLHACIV